MPCFPTADYEFKVVMVGDANVGKTCLAARYHTNKFVHDTGTIGANFTSHLLEIDHAAVKLQIWDIAGQRQFRAIVPLFFRKVNGVMVVYDSTSLQSFDNALFWLKQSLKHVKEDVDVMLVGNKCDCRETREVPTRVASEMAVLRGLDFFETSAKDGTNVNEAFETLARAMKHREEGKGNSLEIMDAVELDSLSAEVVRCF